MSLLLFFAADRGDVNEVRRLVLGLERVDSNWPGGHFALSLASHQHHLLVVRYLLEEARGFDVHNTDHKGKTALHCACDSSADNAGLPLIRYLLEFAGSDVHAKDNEWKTPLHYACIHEHMEVVQYLVEHNGAKVDVVDRNGDTPLSLAVFSGREDIVRYLLPRVESVDKVILRRTWRKIFSWDVRAMVLEKYAVGRQLVQAFETFPIHTILQEFPLPFAGAFRDCVKHFPLETLTRFDSRGRLPVHEALTSSNAMVKNHKVVSTLASRLPASLLHRDPTTGMYPHEATALLLSTHSTGVDWVDARGWFNATYEIYRSNPGRLLCARGGVQDTTTVCVGF